MFRLQKSILIPIILFIFIVLFTNNVQAFDCSTINGLSIFGYDGSEYEFIGSITNEFGSNSIANEFGWGNEFKSKSIFNDFGRYGSEFSSTSAFNNYASKPPVLVDKNFNFIGYLTTNESKKNGVNPYMANYCAKQSLSSTARGHEEVTFKSLDGMTSANNSNIDYSYLLDLLKKSEAISCPINSYLGDDNKCYCNSDYKVNETKDGCEKIVCSINSSLVDGKCVCNSGYVLRNNSCITNTEDCKLTYGSNITGVPNNRGSSDCFCNIGYIFDEVGKNCIQNTSSMQFSEEKNNDNVIDPSNLTTLLPLLGVSRQEAEESKYAKLLDDDIAEYKIILSSEEKKSVINFITYGISAKTLSLGAGERRALIRDYFDTIGKTDIYWQDLENLANGQKVISRNLDKENAQVNNILNKFQRVFGHAPDFNNTKEDLFWNTMMYRIRFSRDLNKEKAGINDFKRIFNYNPESPLDWAIVRALGYALD